VAEAYADVLGRHDERPWVELCMVGSIDGSTVVDGLSKQLSSTTDGAVLGQLRRLADVIVVGAGTVRKEGYGPPQKPGQLVGVVTARGDVDATTPLFTSGAGFIITTTTSTIPASVPAIRAGEDDVDLAAALLEIRTIHPDTAVVQVEGGARLNGSLFAADLVDEINLTTSPLVVGGDGPRLTAAAPDLSHRFELARLSIDDESFVFSRWKRRRH
jgi:riboflavin biosynthesis pyrimidine reductase